MIPRAPAVQWRKSSYSADDANDCVELADLTDVVGLRDSKNPGAGALVLGRGTVGALFSRIRSS